MYILVWNSITTPTHTRCAQTSRYNKICTNAVMLLLVSCCVKLASCFCIICFCTLLRPINASESADKCWSVVETDNENKTVSVRERPQVGAPTKTFTFDKVFGTRSKQLEVYKSVVEPAIEEVLLGYNCTIFA